MKPKKLFHAIVVLGAALGGGCGEASEADAGARDAGEVIADAALDAALADDAGPMDDAGEEDAMVLIL